MTGQDWETIWNHPENAALKRARENPGVLLRGDRVYVPEIKLKTINLETGKRHRIVITGRNVPLRLRMCDADGAPMANVQYILHIGDRDIPIATDGDGKLETKIPATATTAKLEHVQTGEVYTLHLGHMDPGSTSSAIRKRLSNLGYDPDAPDGEIDEHAASVLLAYCEDAELDRQTPPNEITQRMEEKDPWRS